MREMEVGMKFAMHTPPTFFGLEEVNRTIAAGGAVLAIEPGALITQQTGEDADHVKVFISGFALKVKLREPTSDEGEGT